MLRERLGSLEAVRLRDLGARQCGIISFTVADLAPVTVVEGLKERGINLSVSRATSTQINMHRRGLESVVRVGLHYYNSEDEVARFMDALAEVIGQS
jgi:selenocysteine lyase/cysteine desulfurase